MSKKIMIKRDQGWEASPPLCRNCDYFLNGGMRSHPKAGYFPHMCGMGQFNTTPYSVCDKWTAKGEVLAA
jgi:hypothetical protein